MKPILFNTEMVLSILDGRKTVTRRVVKPQPVERPAFKMCQDDVWRLEWWNINEFHSIKVPICIGDILYVRETFRIDYLSNIPGSGRIHYKADDTYADFCFSPARYEMMRRAQLKPGWRPNENMPREAARIFLRVTDVRVEKLWDITEEQAEREGCTAGRIEVTGGPWGVEDDPDEWTARESFVDIWDSTIKKADRALYCWEANPWVWVIEFDQVSKSRLCDVHNTLLQPTALRPEGRAGNWLYLPDLPL